MKTVVSLTRHDGEAQGLTPVGTELVDTFHLSMTMTHVLMFTMGIPTINITIDYDMLHGVLMGVVFNYKFSKRDFECWIRDFIGTFTEITHYYWSTSWLPLSFISFFRISIISFLLCFLHIILLVYFADFPHVKINLLKN